MKIIILLLTFLFHFNNAYSAFIILKDGDSVVNKSGVDIDFLFGTENFVLLKDSTIIKFKSIEYKNPKFKGSEKWFDGKFYKTNDILAYQYEGVYYVRAPKGEKDFMHASTRARNLNQINCFTTFKIQTEKNSFGISTISGKEINFIQKFNGPIVRANKQNFIKLVGNDQNKKKAINKYYQQKRKFQFSFIISRILLCVEFFSAIGALAFLGNVDYGNTAKAVLLSMILLFIFSFVKIVRSKDWYNKMSDLPALTNTLNQIN